MCTSPTSDHCSLITPSSFSLKSTLSLDICCSLQCCLLVLLHFKNYYVPSFVLCLDVYTHKPLYACGSQRPKCRSQFSPLACGTQRPDLSHLVWWQVPFSLSPLPDPWLLRESNTLGLLESSILTFNCSTSSHFQHHMGLSWWLPLALAHRFPFAPQSSWLPCLWSKSFSCVKWECQNKFPSTHKASQRPSAQSSGIRYHLTICFLTRYFLRDPGQATSSMLISFSPPHWTMKLS